MKKAKVMTNGAARVAAIARKTRETDIKLALNLDGEETSYFEWLDAGLLEVRDTAGAMHQVDREPAHVAMVRFGFDRAHLYVRLDGRRPMIDLLAEGLEFSLKFLQPEAVRYSVRQTSGRIAGRFWNRDAATGRWTERGPGLAAVAAGTVLEIAVPLVDLGVAAGGAVVFFVAVYDAEGERERHPANRLIELEAPDEWFVARNWTA